jgi:hypothetical protein
VRDFVPTGTDIDIERIDQAMRDAVDTNEVFSSLAPALTEGAELGVSSVARAEALGSQEVERIVARRRPNMDSIKPTALNRMRVALRKALDGALVGDGPRVILRTLREQMVILKVSADLISRQEVHASYSAAREIALNTTAPSHKEWLTRGDSRVRPTHAAIDDQRVEWNGRFSNGLSRPLDPSGPASEVMNCRCKLMPVYLDNTPADPAQ